LKKTKKKEKDQKDKMGYSIIKKMDRFRQKKRVA
jgi:hypothetical protein